MSVYILYYTILYYIYTVYTVYIYYTVVLSVEGNMYTGYYREEMEFMYSIDTKCTTLYMYRLYLLYK